MTLRSDTETLKMCGGRCVTMCRCYVLDRPLKEALSLHWGSHAESCPVYVVSRDPVDRLADEEYRERFSEIPVTAEALGAWRRQREKTEGVLRG